MSTAALNPRLDEPCAYVNKMRSAETFDRWCYVHHHWLNGAPAESCADRLAREMVGVMNRSQS